MEEISDHAKNLTLSDDLEKTLEDRVNMFYNFVKVSRCGCLCMGTEHINLKFKKKKNCLRLTTKMIKCLFFNPSCIIFEACKLDL